MACSRFVNTDHVCFESVLAMDNADMVAMFESLVDTGLKGFLGCRAVIHEAPLLESLQMHQLGMEWLLAITCGVRINWNRLLFNIFKDMVTPGSRQAKGYAIQISLLLENVPNLELGKSSEFPSSKVLTEKTVHRYIVLNDKVGMEVVTAEPRVKKTPVTKAASKNRPATDAAAKPVVKKKRTTKSKTDSAKETLETLPVEAVPLQMIAPTPVSPAEQPPVPKRKIQKRKRRLILGPMMKLLIVSQLLAKVLRNGRQKQQLGF
ncbi:hypothetical protein F511_10950 [Dorcoceras hygrometricum]|uniref:Uncharacterized protein n=1 Tax=Dorcoceras hygrometricum TaxID=472368 RepID=A0A2Z7A2T7_9LAMI|nr:hypothetical protein F511_10950 [Dorcoceras hygrometricum]